MKPIAFCADCRFFRRDLGEDDEDGQGQCYGLPPRLNIMGVNEVQTQGTPAGDTWDDSDTSEFQFQVGSFRPIVRRLDLACRLSRPRT